MERHEANQQFCKMQGEIASRLGLDTICTCGDELALVGEVPNGVIEEMWRRLTDQRWGKESEKEDVQEVQDSGSAAIREDEGSSAL